MRRAGRVLSKGEENAPYSPARAGRARRGSLRVAILTAFAVFALAMPSCRLGHRFGRWAGIGCSRRSFDAREAVAPSRRTALRRAFSSPARSARHGTHSDAPRQVYTPRQGDQGHGWGGSTDVAQRAPGRCSTCPQHHPCGSTSPPRSGNEARLRSHLPADVRRGPVRRRCRDPRRGRRAAGRSSRLPSLAPSAALTGRRSLADRHVGAPPGQPAFVSLADVAKEGKAATGGQRAIATGVEGRGERQADRVRNGTVRCARTSPRSPRARAPTRARSRDRGRTTGGCSSGRARSSTRRTTRRGWPRGTRCRTTR